jgi:hypothetical protein
MEETKQTSSKVEKELDLQLEFFTESRDQLEGNFKRTMTEENFNQKELREELDKDLDIAAVADHNFSLTLPWEKFFYNLERLVAIDGTDEFPVDLVSEGSGGKPLLPSTKAVFLLNDGEQKEVDLDYMINAYKLDESLMKAQTHMYKLEIERYEKTLQNLEATGKFLTEYNIWNILSKGGDASTVSKS